MLNLIDFNVDSTNTPFFPSQPKCEIKHSILDTIVNPTRVSSRIDFEPEFEGTSAPIDILKVLEKGKPQNDIEELKRKSGLTWEMLAKIFNVSRRALHDWKNGKKVNTSNQIKLSKVLMSLDSFDIENVSENRKILLTPIKGVLPIELLEKDQFDEFDKIKRQFSRSRVRLKISARELARRMPRSPQDFVGANFDTLQKSKNKKSIEKIKKILQARVCNEKK